jgi:hypothetical protein
MLSRTSLETTPARPETLKGLGASLMWNVHACATCGGLVSAGTVKDRRGVMNSNALWVIPAPRSVDSSLPERVAYSLGQAQETLTSPSASVLMAAAAVDAILKEKGLKDGSLYARIEKAATDGIITKEMASVAHDVRLDANAERHVDDQSKPPTDEDAQRCFEFAEALAEMIFVLPRRVKRTALAGLMTAGLAVPGMGG